jgi:hypothetical protein
VTSMLSPETGLCVFIPAWRSSVDGTSVAAYVPTNAPYFDFAVLASRSFSPCNTTLLGASKWPLEVASSTGAGTSVSFGLAFDVAKYARGSSGTGCSANAYMCRSFSLVELLVLRHTVIIVLSL